jgi:hypothetical protein
VRDDGRFFGKNCRADGVRTINYLRLSCGAYLSFADRVDHLIDKWWVQHHPALV